MNSKIRQRSDSTRTQEQLGPKCRFCGAGLSYTLVDLGMSPLCESYLDVGQLNRMEPFYPLRTYVCEDCYLVQLEEYVSPENIFTEYAYYSSYSDAWLQHAEAYTELMVQNYGLDIDSSVVELASNDGYLLQYFLGKGIPVLGIEPALNVAKVAVEKGIPTRMEFFGRECANRLVSEGIRADLLIGNNVLAQVPNLNDFIGGMKILLSPNGVITMEFPHLVMLIDNNQFDTIYHEHFSYFSFTTVQTILSSHGLTLFDVEELPTHGGSLRIFACHEQDGSRRIHERVANLSAREQQVGIKDLSYYAAFDKRVQETKRKLLRFLINARESGKTVVGYGAPGKGNTLLNYCGIRSDLLEFTVDRNPYKQGKFTPGTHIPIYHPDMIRKFRPDYLLILPWNFKDEIMSQMSDVRAWGGQFVVPIPEVEIIP